jgi:uncharacterized protein YpbB
VAITGGGIDKIFAASVNVYPNPTVRNLNVELPIADKTTITIQTIEGRIVEILNTTASAASIDVGTYAQGAYIIQVQQQNNKAQFRFIKQ